MSMTRDAYAKEVIRAAEAAFSRNETAVCPHENCDESLSVVQQNVFSTRSLFCQVHGHVFQEQKTDTLNKLDWDSAKQKYDEECADLDWDEEEEEEECDN